MIENRRKYQRFPYYESVAFQRGPEQPSEGSLSEDISQGGLKLNVPEFVPLNSVLEIQIHVPALSRFINVPAKVVWVRQSPKAIDGWQIGLELVDTKSSLNDVENLTKILKLKSY